MQYQTAAISNTCAAKAGLIGFSPAAAPLLPGEIEPHHLAAAVGTKCSLAGRAIVGVVRAANNGDLPLFATTLGLSGDEFVMLLGERSRFRVELPEGHAELLRAWLPEHFHPLAEMLMTFHKDGGAIDQWLCLALAAACFGWRPFWQDLGLDSREEFARLLSRHFPTLVALNPHGLRWKRFIFGELGERLGRTDVQPPVCDGCACFPSRALDHRHACE